MLSKCAICGGRLEPLFHEVRDPLTDDTFSIHRCVRCGLGHTVPQPTDLDRYYQGNYYGKRHGFTSRYCVQRRLRFVVAAVPDGKGKRLLDIGCGDGSFLLAAREIGWDVVGTEREPGPGRNAGLDVKESLDPFLATMTFDCITMWHTLEHMRDIPSILSNIARLLKPEGKLIVAVPDFGGLQARVFGAKWLHADVPRHLYHFDAKALSHCLGVAGFSVRKKWHQEFEYDLLGWSQSALNFLMFQPNVYFDYLRGKRGRIGRLPRFYGIVLGSLLTVMSLPPLALGTLSGRGGTLIMMVTHLGTTEKITA
jgi:SAM-dependent methyltransferase